VIHCGSYSKSIAPGLRVGWIVAGKSRFHRIKSLKYATSLANATTSELVVTEFLKSGGMERHLRKVRRLLEDAFTFEAYGCEYIANILEQRQRAPVTPSALHLTRRQDLLELEIPPADLSRYQ
jgi:aspartate/methionine/tyrosine aminotransferase